MIHKNNLLRIQVTVENKRTFDAKIIRLDFDYDIAIIKIVGEDKFPYFLQLASDSEIVDGSEAFFAGYPLLETFELSGIEVSASISNGLINRKPGQTYISKKEMEIIEISAVVNPGNSGGPLFIPKDGKVIGVVTRAFMHEVHGRKISAGISFAVPVKYVRALYFEGSDLTTDTQSEVTHNNAKIKDIIRTILYEFEDNLSRIKDNSSIFCKNIELLKSGKISSEIPLYLVIDAWRKIKLENIITFNIIKEDIKKSIEECYRDIEIYNALLKRREENSINWALSGYSELLLQGEKGLLILEIGLLAS